MPAGWVAAAAALSGYLGADASKNAAQTQAQAAKEASAVQMNMFNKTQGNLQPWMESGRMSLAALSQGLGLGIPQGTSGAPQINWDQYLKDNPDVAASGMYGNNPQAHYADWGMKEGRKVSYLPQQDGSGLAAGTGIAPGSLLKPFGMEDFQASPAYQFNLEQGQKAIDKSAARRGNFYAPATLQDISRFSQGLASNEFQNAFSNYNTNKNAIWQRLFGMSGSGQNAAVNLGGFGAAAGNTVGNNIIGAGNAQAAGQVGAANAYTGAANTAYNNYMMQQSLANNQQSSVPTTYIEQGQ